MNGDFYQNPTFPTAKNDDEISVKVLNNVVIEQSYIENILRMNKDKKIKAYVSYPDSSAWQNKIYEGTIEAAGTDHLIIKDLNGIRYLIRLIYLDYVEFLEPIAYSYPITN